MSAASTSSNASSNASSPTSPPSTSAATACTIEQQIAALRQRLRTDLTACDMQWTLFVAAAQSGRYHSKLSPYPARFASDPLNGAAPPAAPTSSDTPPSATSNPPLATECDIGAILRLIAAVPRLTRIVWPKLRPDAVELLHWVLCVHGQQTVRLQTVAPAEHAGVLATVGSASVWMPPVLQLFRVLDGCKTDDQKQLSSAERRFAGHLVDERTQRTRATLHAFHGSRLESFHSISTRGLQQHLSNEGLFGEGIYLSSESSVSLPFSTVGGGWRMTGLGTELSCMAICEFVDHERHLKRRTSENSKNDMPDKYFVITNNDIVRVRYLVLFGKPLQSPPPPIDDGYSPEMQADANSQHALVSTANNAVVGRPAAANPAAAVAPLGIGGHARRVFRQNLAFCSVLVYVLMLLAVGLAHSETGQYWRHRAGQRIGDWLIERGWHWWNTSAGGEGELTLDDLAAAIRLRYERGDRVAASPAEL